MPQSEEDALFAMLNSFNKKDYNRYEILHAPFGYHGGKSRSVKHILEHLPMREAYIEVFGGSGIVLLNRDESINEVYNDRYGGVVAFYRCLRDEDKMRQLQEKLQCVLHSREEFEFCKATWENVDDDIERAFRWYYMLNTSFGNQGRNFGRCIKGKTQAAKKIANHLLEFLPVHNRIKRVQIENLDWRDCLNDFDDRKAVFYLDPPYLDVADYIYKHDMSRADHIEMCERIFRMQGFVALSGYENTVYNKYPWTAKYSWTVMHSAETGKREDAYRGQVEEVLWVKEAS